MQMVLNLKNSIESYAPEFQSVLRYGSGYHLFQFAVDYNAFIKRYRFDRQTDRLTPPILRTVSPNVFFSPTNIIKQKKKTHFGIFLVLYRFPYFSSTVCSVYGKERKRTTISIIDFSWWCCDGTMWPYSLKLEDRYRKMKKVSKARNIII